MNNLTLTPKQTELLDAIKDFRKSKGYSPANSDLAAIMKVSTVRIFQQIKCLELAGAIKVLGKKAIQIKDEIPYTERQLQVMKAFAKNPDATQSEVAKALDIAPSTLQQEHLSRLVSLGAIEMENGKVTVLDKSVKN